MKLLANKKQNRLKISFTVTQKNQVIQTKNETRK